MNTAIVKLLMPSHQIRQVVIQFYSQLTEPYWSALSVPVKFFHPGGLIKSFDHTPTAAKSYLQYHLMSNGIIHTPVL